MQVLDNATIIGKEDLECASEVIETILLGMRTLREGMRRGKPRDLSVPQFRVLAFIRRHAGASLSDAAEYIGLTLPSMSKAVDGLVKRGLIERRIAPDDRRRVTLSLTGAGEQGFQSAIGSARSRIAAILKSLSPEQRREVAGAARILRSMLASESQEAE